MKRQSRSAPAPVAVVVLGLMATILLSATPAWGQDASVLGEVIARACGTVVDPLTQGVIAGVVSDSLSSTPLPNARVKIVWQGDGDAAANTAEVTTDRTGFYAFCAVPAGVIALLSATLERTSPARAIAVEAGMLNVEPILLPVSDPRRPGILVGRIVDAASRAPLDGVSVRIMELDVATLTNERGYFSLGERTFGVYTIRMERLGYAPREISIHVTGNLTQNVEIELPQQPIEVEGITVRVAPRRMRRDMEGMIRRMNLGFGSFLTRETLERRPDAPLVELLREVPGISVFRDGMRAFLEVRGRSCTPDVYMDGLPFPLDPSVGLNEFITQELEAIEVFRGTEVPGEFIRAGFRAPCMVILLWTRPSD